MTSTSRSIAFLSALCLLFAAQVAMAEVKVSWVAGKTPQGIPNFAAELDTFINTATTEINDKIKSQDSLAKGMANASAYASQAATLQGYQGYDIFAVMGGGMLGVQLPTFSMSEIMKVPDKMSEDMDVYAGVAMGAAVNVGINAGYFGLKPLHRDLYFNIKFMKYDQSISDVEASMTTFGLQAAWQVVGFKGFGGLLRWRGVSVGTGFMLNKNNVSMTLAEGLPAVETDYLRMEPALTVGINSNAYSIPFEATTSVQLLYLLNLNLGLGMDFNFGHGDVVINSPANVYTKEQALGNGTTIPEEQVGTLTVDASTLDKSPSSVRMRIMTGVGFNFGPLKIDIPLTWYLSSGLSVGVTGGVVW